MMATSFRPYFSASRILKIADTPSQQFWGNKREYGNLSFSPSLLPPLLCSRNAIRRPADRQKARWSIASSAPGGEIVDAAISISPDLFHKDGTRRLRDAKGGCNPPPGSIERSKPFFLARAFQGEFRATSLLERHGPPAPARVADPMQTGQFGYADQDIERPGRALTLKDRYVQVEKFIGVRNERIGKEIAGLVAPGDEGIDAPKLACGAELHHHIVERPFARSTHAATVDEKAALRGAPAIALCRPENIRAETVPARIGRRGPCARLNPYIAIRAGMNGLRTREAILVDCDRLRGIEPKCRIRCMPLLPLRRDRLGRPQRAQGEAQTNEFADCRPQRLALDFELGWPGAPWGVKGKRRPAPAPR